MINLDGVDDVVNIDGNFSVDTFFVVLNCTREEEIFTRYESIFSAEGIPAHGGRKDESNLFSALGGSWHPAVFINADYNHVKGRDFSPFSDFKVVSVVAPSAEISNSWKVGKPSFGWKGNIAEIVVFDRPLEDHQSYSMDEYLSSKWGLSSKMYRPYVPSNSFFTLDTNGTLKTATTFDYESNASNLELPYRQRMN